MTQLDRVLPEYRLLHSLLVGIKESLEEAESQFEISPSSGR